MKEKDDCNFFDFIPEKASLKNAIKVLEKYKLPGNLKHYKDYQKHLDFLIDFENNFILGA